MHICSTEYFFFTTVTLHDCLQFILRDNTEKFNFSEDEFSSEDEIAVEEKMYKLRTSQKH
jgi:hypothetical protein